VATLAIIENLDVLPDGGLGLCAGCKGPITSSVNPSPPRALVVANSVESECEELAAELNSYNRLEEGDMSAVLRVVRQFRFVTKGCH
jgi:hypothetical protein